MVLKVIGEGVTVEDREEIEERVGEALADELFRPIVAKGSDGEQIPVKTVDQIVGTQEIFILGPFAGG